MERTELEQFALWIKEAFGTAPWTVHQVLERAPVEILPSQVRYALDRAGAWPSRSLGQLLSSSPLFFKRGTVHARKQLWLSVAQADRP